MANWPSYHGLVQRAASTAIYDIRNPNQVLTWRRKLDESGVAAFGIWGQQHSSIKNEHRSPVPRNAAITYSAHQEGAKAAIPTPSTQLITHQDQLNSILESVILPLLQADVHLNAVALIEDL